jgi:hypothetical protein
VPPRNSCRWLESVASHVMTNTILCDTHYSNGDIIVRCPGAVLASPGGRYCEDRE